MATRQSSNYLFRLTARASAPSTRPPTTLPATARAQRGASHHSSWPPPQALSTVSSLATVVGSDVLYGSLLPAVLGMVSDAVPNVRFNVAKTLQMLVPLLEPGLVASQVKPKLLELSEDHDKDVQYFAQRALACCG